MPRTAQLFVLPGQHQDPPGRLMCTGPETRIHQGRGDGYKPHGDRAIPVRCDCGAEFTVMLANFIPDGRGRVNTRSCGCLRGPRRPHASSSDMQVRPPVPSVESDLEAERDLYRDLWGLERQMRERLERELALLRDVVARGA